MPDLFPGSRRPGSPPRQSRGYTRDRMRVLRRARALGFGRCGRWLTVRVPFALLAAARRATGITGVRDVIAYALLVLALAPEHRSNLRCRARRTRR